MRCWTFLLPWCSFSACGGESIGLTEQKADPDEGGALVSAGFAGFAGFPVSESDCGDGQDEDYDGLVDCEDPDCDCPESECEDGLDEDLDGLVDCEDGDCWELCTEQVCDDGLDEDLDGLVDCLDDDCFYTSACPHYAALVTITGGSGTVVDSLLQTAEYNDTYPLNDSLPPEIEWRVQADLYSLTGFVDIRSTAATTATVDVCGWSVGWLQANRIIVSRYLVDGDLMQGSGVSVRYSDLQLSSACVVDTVPQLMPDKLWPEITGVIHRPTRISYTANMELVSATESVMIPMSTSGRLTGTHSFSSSGTVRTYFGGTGWRKTYTYQRAYTSVFIPSFTTGVPFEP